MDDKINAALGIILVISVLGILQLTQDTAESDKEEILAKAVDKMENSAPSENVLDTYTISAEKVSIDGNQFYNWTVGFNTSSGTGKWAASENTTEVKTQNYLVSTDGKYIFYPPWEIPMEEHSQPDNMTIEELQQSDFNQDNPTELDKNVSKEEVQSRAESMIEDRLNIDTIHQVETIKFEPVQRRNENFYLWELDFEIDGSHANPKWDADNPKIKTKRYLVSKDGDHIFLLPWHTRADSISGDKDGRLVDHPENVIVQFERSNVLLIRFNDRINQGKYLEEII